MPGLLDIFNGDDGQQALGLLAAAGPSMQPMNLASRLALAGKTYNELKDNQLANQYRQALIGNLNSEVDQRKATIEKMNQGLGMLSSVLGSKRVDAQPGQLGSGTMGIVPNANPLAPAPTTSGLANATPDQLAAIKAGLGVDLLPEYKVAKEGFERKPNTFYESVNGGIRYMPDPTKGMAFDPATGKVSVLPGFNDFTVQQTLNTEAPKALLAAAGKVNLRDMGNGQQTPVSELAENPTLQNILGQLFTQAPGRASLSGASAGPMTISPAEQKARDAGAIRLLSDELKKPDLSPQDRAGIQRQLAAYQASQTAPGFPTTTIRTPAYGMTTEQKAAAAAEQKGAEARATGDETNFTNYRNTLAEAVKTGQSQFQRNQQIRQLMKDYQTGLVAPDARAAFASQLVNTFPGNSTVKAFAERVNGGNVGNAQELANLLSAAGLTNVIKTLDGNGRVNKAEYQALAEHAESNRTDPSAMEGIMAYQDKVYLQDLAEQNALAAAIKAKTVNPATWQADYANQRHEALVKSGAAPTPAQAQQKQTLLSELPKTAPKGQKVRDTATGKVLQFNGLSWVEVK